MHYALDPCPANINKSSDYFEYILALSSVAVKNENSKHTRESTQKEYNTHTPGLKLWVIVSKNLIHTAPCESLCLES